MAGRKKKIKKLIFFNIFIYFFRETKLQVRQELDLARMKMRSLEVELRSQGIEPLPGFDQMDEEDVEEINEFPCNT